MGYKGTFGIKKQKLHKYGREKYYFEVIKPLIYSSITFNQMFKLGMIFIAPETAIELTKEFGTDEDILKSKLNVSLGKASSGKKTKGRPSGTKGKTYEEILGPEKAAKKREQARKFWIEHNPRKYFTSNNISKGQRLLFEKVKELYPTAVLEYPIDAPGKKYYLDIAVPSLKLDFEYDGFYWHSFPEAKVRDAKRDMYLKELGWKVFRYSFNARNDLEVKSELLKLNINIQNIENGTE